MEQFSIPLNMGFSVRGRGGCSYRGVTSRVADLPKSGMQPTTVHCQLCTYDWHPPALRADVLTAVLIYSNGDQRRRYPRRPMRQGWGAPKTIAVRLAEVDAPEKAQPCGIRSKENLSAQYFHKSAEVRPVSMDRYGRTVAHVNCDGHDAGAEQIRAGMAWVFVRYAAKGSPLYGLEREARLHGRGLWRDAQRVAPWDWRRSVHRDTQVGG
jgi:endonuclease YncB( thermonuclease family)